MEKVKRISKLEVSGRITPREVLEAYEETGFAPLFGWWFKPLTHEACALTAVAFATGYGNLPLNSRVAVMLLNRMDALPFRTAYRLGFANGFDGGELADDYPEDEERTEGFRAGYRDGKRARAFVKARL